MHRSAFIALSKAGDYARVVAKKCSHARQDEHVLSNAHLLRLAFYDTPLINAEHFSPIECSVGKKPTFYALFIFDRGSLLSFLWLASRGWATCKPCLWPDDSAGNFCATPEPNCANRFQCDV